MYMWTERFEINIKFYQVLKIVSNMSTLKYKTWIELGNLPQDEYYLIILGNKDKFGFIGWHFCEPISSQNTIADKSELRIFSPLQTDTK